MSPAEIKRRKAGQKLWRERHKAEIRSYTTKWRAAHRDRVLIWHRCFHELHPEAQQRYAKKWRAKHHETIREAWRRYQTRKRAAGALAGHHTRSEWLILLLWHGGCCVHCGSSDRLTRDHIVPLSRGGTDHILNIQPLCRPCNAKKGARVDVRKAVRVDPNLFDLG